MPHSYVTALHNTHTQITPLQLIVGYIRQPLPVNHCSKLLTPPFSPPPGYVGMQLVPKTTRNPHQIGGVVLRLGAWSGAGRVWGRAAGEEGQTAGPVPVPLPGSLRGLDTSVRQKQTSRRTPAQTGVPWQRFGAEVLSAWRRTHRQVSSMCEKKHTALRRLFEKNAAQTWRNCIEMALREGAWT